VNLLKIQRNVRDWLVAESQAAATCLGEGAAPGLAVHLNTYRGQLLACLRETYATVRAWLGDAAFEAAGAIHIDRVPPSSWTLDDYARDFPDTLQALYPQDPEIVEIACLERTLCELFIAPDCLALRPDAVDPDKWARIDWDLAALRLVPTVRLLPVATNAAAIWSAIAEDKRPPAVEHLAAPSRLLLWRCEYSSRFRSLEAREADALERVANGMTFGALCGHLVDRCGAIEAPQLAAAWLGQWLRDGLIAEII
jgi:Putative DNA-binding domain